MAKKYKKMVPGVKSTGRTSNVTSQGFLRHLKCVGVEDLMDNMFRRSEEYMRGYKVFSQYSGN